AWGVASPSVSWATREAAAQGAWREHAATHVFACLDARMREVYVAAYAREDGCWSEALAPAVLKPDDVAPPPRGRAPWFGVGGGFAAYPSLQMRLALECVDADAVPDARAVGELALPPFAPGDGAAAAHALPLYVRHRVALTTAERAAGARFG